MKRLTEKGTLDGSYFVKQKDQSSSIIKLGELEDIEEELGISILDFYKILKAKYIWAEVGLDLTDIFNEFVLFDIKGFDVELNRILLKENKYNLTSIPFNMYKICFWLRKDKSE